MKAMELARMLLMTPDATVVIDTRSDKTKRRPSEPFVDIDLKASVEGANEGWFAITVADSRGWARAKK